MWERISLFAGVETVSKDILLLWICCGLVLGGMGGGTGSAPMGSLRNRVLTFLGGRGGGPFP